MTQPKLILHGTPLSGHSHRVGLLLSMLHLPYQFQDADGAYRGTDAFRQLNPLGQVPVLQDGDLVLPDSNAILVYLARRYAPGSHWLPDGAVDAAQVQRWLSIAAGELRRGPAAARMAALWGMDEDPQRAAVIAGQLLAVMDTHLAGRRFLATDQPTIADLACYSYVAHAPEGGIALEPYGNVLAWLRRVEALPDFHAMPAFQVPQS